MFQYGNYRNYYDTVVSEDFQKDIIKYIFQGYLDADKMIKANDLQPQPAKNLYPYARWAMIDNYCLALNKKYNGVEVTSQCNTIHNCFYTLIRRGNVRMTISSVGTPNSLPRIAIFRNNLARCQYHFDIDDTKTKFEFKTLERFNDAIIYAFILHGPKVDNHKIPSFIKIVFPNEDCTRSLERIDLFKIFPKLIEDLSLEGMEIVPDEAKVTLRKDVYQGKLI